MKGVFLLHCDDLGEVGAKPLRVQEVEITEKTAIVKVKEDAVLVQEVGGLIQLIQLLIVAKLMEGSSVMEGGGGERESVCHTSITNTYMFTKKCNDSQRAYVKCERLTDTSNNKPTSTCIAYVFETKKHINIWCWFTALLCLPICFLVEDWYLMLCLALVSKGTDYVLKLDVGGWDWLLKERLDVA